MANYLSDKIFEKVNFDDNGINFTEFESCRFLECDFSRCTFVAVTFIDTQFENCNFVGANINYVALRTAHFIRCNMTDVNFAMCDKLIFEVKFTGCILDRAKFYSLKLRRTIFTGCSIIAVDLMNADISDAVFDKCDMHRTVFDRSVAIKADFSTAKNYILDPERNKIKGARFSKDGLQGLLQRHELVLN